MKFISRNILFKLVILIILIFPLVPASFTPYLGFVAGAYYVLYLIMDKEAFHRFKRARRHFKFAFSLLSFLFVILALFSILYSKDKALSFRGFLVYLSAFILFLIIKYEINRPNHITPLLRAYFVSSLFVALYHVWQILYTEVILGVPFDTLTQVSVMNNGPILAYFLLIPLFPALALYIYNENIRTTRFYLVVLTASLISIFMSDSRIAVIGVFLGLFLLSLLYSFKFLIALIPTGLFLALIPIFSKRHSTFFVLSQELGRFRLWQEVVMQDKSFLFLGRGFNTFEGTFQGIMQGKVELRNLNLINHPYNAPLQLMMELGLLGLILGLLIAFNMLKAIVAYTRSAKASAFFKVAYVGVLVSMVVLIVLNLIDSYIMDPKIMYSIAILMGIMHGEAKFKGIRLT